MRERQWVVRKSLVDSWVPRHPAAALRADVEGGKAEACWLAKPGELPEDAPASEPWNSRRERRAVLLYMRIRVSPFQEAT